jgi:hypothetical protein
MQQSSSVEENLDLRRYPADSPERNFCPPLKLDLSSPSGQKLGVFLEAAGWVRDTKTSEESAYFIPPTASYIVRALKTCVSQATDWAYVDGFLKNSSRSREISRIFDSPEGRVPTDIPPTSPQDIVMAMAARILKNTSPNLAHHRADVLDWRETIFRTLSPMKEMESLGASSQRFRTHRGETLVAIDRQTGTVSLLPTGDEMGGFGPFSQKTKIYDPAKRKMLLAVVMHRPSAIRQNSERSNPKALAKSLLRGLRQPLAEEILSMTDKDFESSMGKASLEKLRQALDPRKFAAMQALSESATAARSLVERGDQKDRSVLLKSAAERVVSDMDKFDSSTTAPARPSLSRSIPKTTSAIGPVLTHPLDLLLDASADYPHLFQAYTTKNPQMGSAMHLHGLSPRLFRGIFSAMEHSPDFVMHPSHSADYDEIYRMPFEGSIDRIASELGSDSSRSAHRAHQFVRGEIMRMENEGSVGFLELVRGRGVVLLDGKPQPPTQAMRSMLGPECDALGVKEEILEEISEKIDVLSAALGGKAGDSGVGSIRDFCSQIEKKKEAAIALFGETRVKEVLAARAALRDAHKSREMSDRAGRIGMEKSTLQKAVSECLSVYFFGEGLAEEDPRKKLVNKLVHSAASTEFVYFAVQLGAEGILKIGKANDVSARMEALSREGHEVLPLAKIAIPSLPVGDWCLSSVPCAVRKVMEDTYSLAKSGKSPKRPVPSKSTKREASIASAEKAAKTLVGKLKGLYRESEFDATADFFMAAVEDALEARGKTTAPENVQKTPESLTEEEMVDLMTESQLISAPVAREIHGLVKAVTSSRNGTRTMTEAQGEIRDASARVLSSIVAQVAWGDSSPSAVQRVAEGFYGVDESTQMPTCDKAWGHRVQSGSVRAEAILHAKYAEARVHGEWFHLLSAAPAVISDAEKIFGLPSTKFCDPACPHGIVPIVSAVQKSGVHVTESAEFLHQHRLGYNEAFREATLAEQSAATAPMKMASQNPVPSRIGPVRLQAALRHCELSAPRLRRSSGSI